MHTLTIPHPAISMAANRDVIPGRSEGCVGRLDSKGESMFLLRTSAKRFLRRTLAALSLAVVVELTPTAAASDSPGTRRDHPFLFISPKEVAEARARLGREPWKSMFDELQQQVKEDLEVPLPAFETEWWQNAKTRPWGEIYPQIAQHTTFVPWKPMAAAHRISTLYLLTGDERLAEHLLKVLRHYSAYTFEFEHYDVGMNYAGWGTAALDVYDRIYDRCTDDDRREIDAFFLRMGRAIWSNDQQWIEHGWGGKHNNHFAWHRMALCGLGLFFGNQEYVDHALHGPEGVVELMNTGLMDEGLWLESSIHYHFTALYGLVRIAEMLRHVGHPFDLYHRQFARGRTFKSMFDAPLLTLFPDGTIPNVGDSYGRLSHIWDMPWYEYAYSVYGDPRYAWVLSQGKRRADVASLHGREIGETLAPAVTTQVSREHGYAFLRADDASTDWHGGGLVAMLNFDRNGIHCHHDHLSLILFGGGRLLAPDPEARTTGHAFSRPVQRELNRSAICHNTIVVDGRVDQGILTEPLEIAAWNPAGKEKSITVVDPRERVYPGVKLSRTLTLSGSRLRDEFHASSKEPHTYEWLFHAYDDEGKVRGNLSFQPVSLPEKGPWLWIRNARKASTDDDWELFWRQGDVELRLGMAGVPGTEIIACDFPQDDDFTFPPISMLIVRRTAAETTFSAAYEVQTKPARP
jgi:hypothetical protein